MSNDHDDFAFEPTRGLPAPLPQGERLIWQGAPRWTALAVSAFHIKYVAAYFAILALWRITAAWPDGAAAAATAGAWTALLALATMAILAGLAYLYARTTVYSLTTKRVVIRSGLALPVTLNLPLALVASAALARGPGGTSGIALEIAKPNRIAWLALWPNARPWAFNRPQPMLRALADGPAVAALLVKALASSGPGVAQPFAAEAAAQTLPAAASAAA